MQCLADEAFCFLESLQVCALVMLLMIGFLSCAWLNNIVPHVHIVFVFQPFEIGYCCAALASLELTSKSHQPHTCVYFLYVNHPLVGFCVSLLATVNKYTKTDISPNPWFQFFWILNRNTTGSQSTYVLNNCFCIFHFQWTVYTSSNLVFSDQLVSSTHAALLPLSLPPSLTVQALQ